MSIYVNKANENWIVDKFRKEFYQNTTLATTKFHRKSNKTWIIAPWTWNRLNKNLLDMQYTVCTVHHIDFEKFDKGTERNFYELDKFVDTYHTISKNSFKDLSKLTNKKIEVIPFWVNQENFFHIENKNLLTNKYNLPQNKFLIGSFQRDTEGHDLISPKLSKGPDILIEYLIQFKKNKPNLHVILAGKRRQFIISKLKENNIPFTYFEMVDQKSLNELYNLIDLYIVSSRVEGGPQSILECAITKTPVISHSVGIAPEILSIESLINDNKILQAKPNLEFAYNSVLELTIPQGVNRFDKLFNK